MSTDRLDSNLNSAFSLPQEVVNDIEQISDVRMAFTVYNSPALFPVRNTLQRTATPNTSTVVSSQVVSVSVGGIQEGAVLSDPVRFLLRLTNLPAINETEKVISARGCAFWDFDAAGEFSKIHNS